MNTPTVKQITAEAKRQVERSKPSLLTLDEPQRLFARLMFIVGARWVLDLATKGDKRQ